MKLLKAGVGWGSLPDRLVARDLAEGRLVRLPARKLGAGGAAMHDAYFSHRNDEALGLAARCLGESLEAVAARS